MGGGETFSVCAQRLSAACALDGADPAPRDYERVRADLIRLLLARFGHLGADEITELADETMARLLRESRQQGKALENTAGWLTTVAANLALDRLRQRKPDPLAEEDWVEGDQTTRLLERMTARDHLDSAFARAIRAGDDIAVKVVAESLDVLQEEGAMPSSRHIAKSCGYSHTTVLQALRRFAEYLK